MEAQLSLKQLVVRSNRTSGTTPVSLNGGASGFDFSSKSKYVMHMSYKLCGKCGNKKNVTEFAVKYAATGRLNSYCRKCQSKYYRVYYSKHRREHWIRNVRNRAYNNATIVSLILSMKSAPCVDCGRCFEPVAMDFDHTSGGKKYNISAMMRTQSSFDLILTEVGKCEVVCACCHRVRTAIRGGRYKWYSLLA